MSSSTGNTTMAIVPSPSTSFAKSLKTYGTISYGEKNERRLMVVGFDKELFIRTCSTASDDYDETKCNYDDIMTELFKVGETWISRELVDLAVTLVSEKHGWLSTKKQCFIRCNRFGKNDNESRDFANGSLQSGCTLQIAIKALVTTRYLPEGQKDKDKKKWSYRHHWDQPVEIKEGTCTTHGGNCQPGRQNRVAVMSRAGVYIKKMPDNALFRLCNIAEHGGKLSTNSIKSVMRVAWPKAKLATKQDIFNIRVKVMKLMPTFRKSNQDYETFKEVVNASDMLQGIDNEELTDDEAYQLGYDLWLELVNTTNTKEEAMMSFIEYLELIKARAKGFTYKLAETSEDANISGNNNKKLLGVMWMTATMRRNFELFGGYICLDMMKRGLNTLLWPYVAVTMYDENMKLCLAAEGILCGERFDMYHFVAAFLGESAPRRPLSEVNIVAGDGFFDQEMIVALGFTHANFINDQWHLLDSGLCKMFGKGAYALLKGHLVRMVKATSETEYEEVLHSAKELLLSQPKRNGQMEQDLATFASRRKTYSTYCIAQLPGNLGRHGSSISESNHASTLVYLNDGNKKGNNFCEHPIVLIRELLMRQKNHVSKANMILWQDCQKMRSAIATLQLLPSTQETQDLLRAVQELNLTSYERYREARGRSNNFRVDSAYVADHESPQDTCTAVINTLTEETPRLFPTFESRCGCVERLANEDMCPHEIAAKGGYNKAFFKERHMSRKSVEGSLVGWVEDAVSSIDEMIGYELENLTPNGDVGIGIGSADGDVMMADATNLQTYAPLPPPPLPPPGYLPPKSVGKVQPLAKKYVQNVLNSTIDQYNGMTKDRKHLISSLVLDLEHQLTIDTTQSKSISTSTSGHVVDAPSNYSISSQPRNRLLPTHEVVANKRKASAPHLGVMMQPQLAEIGREIQVNTKTRKLTCSFCDDNHMITSCDLKQEFCLNATEYVLTTESPQNADTLCNRIKNMPTTEGCGERPVPFDTLSKDHIKMNFIIKESRPNDDGSVIYNVSFIGSKGVVTQRDVWITAKALNSITTHTNKKKKYVYDQTIIVKQLVAV